MNWIFLALLAPFIYALNVFLDKYLVEARIPDYRSLPIFSAIVALPVTIGLWFFSGFALLDLVDTFLIILSGIFTILAFSLYLEALIKEETSLLIILIQLIPVIVLVLSSIILGETISLKQFFGFLLLMSSSILVSLKKEKSKFIFSRALVFILLADLLWSIPYILIKFVSGSVNFIDLIMYESFGVVLGGLALVLFISVVRKAFIKTMKKVKKGDLSLILMNEGLFLGGKILTYMAVTLGPVAIISVLGSTQIFYGILLGVILTMLLPKVFKEDLSRQGLYKKIFLGAVAFVGVILVS